MEKVLKHVLKLSPTENVLSLALPSKNLYLTSSRQFLRSILCRSNLKVRSKFSTKLTGKQEDKTLATVPQFFRRFENQGIN